MMKIASLLLLLAFLVQAALGAADVDADDAWVRRPRVPWIHRRRPFFPMPPLPAHKWPKPSPGAPNSPKLDPAILKCFADKFEEGKCVGEIRASYWNKKVTVGADCCKIVQQVSDDCAKSAFKGSDSPYFGRVLKQYCAKKA